MHSASEAQPADEMDRSAGTGPSRNGATLWAAKRIFHCTVAVAVLDAAVLAACYHRYPNYVVLGAAAMALAGTLAMWSLGLDDSSSRREEWGEGFSTFAVFTFFLAFYAATGSLDMTAFNAHVRQAFSFLQGHTYIDAPNWIEHAHFKGYDYQLHPPLPAFLIMPVVAIWGMDTNQVVLSLLFGALDVAMAWRMLRCFDLDLNARVWLTVFFGAGTIVWTETVNGSSWEVTMLVANVFTFAALGEIFSRAHAARVGLWAGLAALARYDLAFVWPFYIGLMIARRKGLRDLAAMLPGFALAAVVFVVFNEVRYGGPFDRGVFIFAIPSETQHLFSLQYLPGNLYTLLFMAPSVNGNFPYIHPTIGGQCILLTSPAFVLALRPSFRRAIPALLILAAFVAIIPSLFYFTNGFAQFGTRHYMHAFPFLLALIALGSARRADQMMRMLIGYSVLLIAFFEWHLRMYGFG